MTRTLPIAIVLLIVVLSGTGPRRQSTAAHAALPPRGAHVSGVQTTQPDGLRTLTLYSAALGGATHVNIALPDGYASSRRRYPVLYLLAGHTGVYWQWADKTDVVSFTRGLPLIVVMLDGRGGWYSNPVSGVGPRWADYLIDDLIPYVDAHYRTIAGRAGRAVAGPSMGGLGAFDYAALHPDLFAAAASFSGSLSLTGMEGPAWRAAFPDLAVFGDPRADALYWAGHDPVALAPNLRGVRLYLASGNGRPGPFEPHGHSPDPDPGEQYSLTSLQEMAAALAGAGITATVEDYGPGVHTWPYWQRDLHDALPLMMDTFAHPPAPPLPWSYRTIDRHFNVWGYRFGRAGGAPGWTELQDVSRAGLTVDGMGGLFILVTAPLYRPSTPYALTIDDVRQPRTVRADATGRLSLALTLAGAATRRRLSITLAPSSL
jgi:S-formylglutathione hydrolase FrmB